MAVVLGFNDPGDASAPAGTRPWAVSMYNALIYDKHSLETTVPLFRGSLENMKKENGWKQLCNEKGQPFKSWEEFCMTREPFGLGLTLGQVNALLEAKAAKDVKLGQFLKEFMDSQPKLAAHGTNQHTAKEEDGPYNVRSTSKTNHGNNKEYLARRLKRDAPDIAARIDEFPSIHAAAVAAGIVKKPPTIAQLKTLWRKASSEEKAEFFAFIETPED